MDDADRAKVLEMQYRQRAIDAARHRKHEAPMLNKQNQRICKECGDVIKSMRLAAVPHAVRCMPCQSVYEHERERGMVR